LKKRDSFISYSQNQEDVILEFLFRDVKYSEYVEIGCNDPIVESTSYWAYKRGWRGVLIDPNPYYSQLAKIYRPDDWFFNIGVGMKNEIRNLFMPENLPPTRASYFESYSRHLDSDPIILMETQLLKLEVVLELCNLRQIAFMSIDTEGMETEVILSNNWEKFRPEILLVESKKPDGVDERDTIQGILKEFKYDLLFSDDLNSWFAKKESSKRYSNNMRDALKNRKFVTRHEVFLETGN
jgi:FkbM family methyltransferase